MHEHLRTIEGKRLFEAADRWELLPPVSKPGNKVMFIFTGEKRQPKRGEFYLSGAIPEAYKALSESTVQHIARPIEVEREVVFKIVRTL